MSIQPTPASRELAINASDSPAAAGDVDSHQAGSHAVPPAVRTQRLGKRYGPFQALIDLTLQVERGEVFGLLGPNGAGKTTLLRTLLGFLQRTSGTAEVMGIDPAIDSVAVRRQVSYLPGDARLPRHMRGRAVLRFFAEIQPAGDLENCLAVADRLELDLRRHVGFMSTGMRQKLAIAAVVGSRAPLLILDEPTANLDPTVRSRVLEMVSEAKEAGRTVIFSSHVLSEIEEVCDRVALLRSGRLAHQQSLHTLKARHRIVASWVPAAGSMQRSGAESAALDVPAALADSIVRTQVEGPHTTIETAGDLAPLLPWLGSLGLQQMRVEAYGLRAVYDSVHGEQVVEV